MAGLYAIYHGPEGLSRIADRSPPPHQHRGRRAARRRASTWCTARSSTRHRVGPGPGRRGPRRRAGRGVNLRRIDADTVGISVDETTDRGDVDAVWQAFGIDASVDELDARVDSSFPQHLTPRTTPLLTHPVFHQHRSETDMLRYLRRLTDRDLALDRTMIPLGSCTMKLNATTEMIPVTWPEFGVDPPLRRRSTRWPATSSSIADLEAALAEITGYDAVSLQPNAGSQGELAGLLAIQAYHASRGDTHRDVCLIPASAHGTNAASAVMAGLEVVVVACDDDGNVDLADLRRQGRRARRRGSSCLMVTYPSTHGVFEEAISEICGAVHDARRAGVPRRRQPQRAGRGGPARPLRRRRLAPQPPQDLLHPPRRRRARRRAGRGPRPPGPVPAQPPPRRRGRTRHRHRRRSRPRPGDRPASCPSRGRTSR